LYIGRTSPTFCIVDGKKMRWPTQSKWHNPYTISYNKISKIYSVKKGSKELESYKNESSARSYAIEQYKNYVSSNKHLSDSLFELTGKNLGCWCKPQPCHGDVLVSLWKKHVLL
jgi:hypothetical protein